MASATLMGSFYGRPMPMWIGVLGHEGGTLLVVAHSLLLLLHAAPGGVQSVFEESDSGEGQARPVEATALA